METIEIDFDVYKALTIRRESEEVTYNDVLRDLLGLNPAVKEKKMGYDNGGSPWVVKGVTFPHGTEFRATYKGLVYTGKVENGALVVDGKRFSSPSAAAGSITNNLVNGWIFWECKLPGQSYWVTAKQLRKS